MRVQQSLGETGYDFPVVLLQWSYTGLHLTPISGM